MSHTADDYTGELLVPGPETRVKLADLLERRARLSEELALAQHELTAFAPEGFAADAPGGACCGSPIIGWIPKSIMGSPEPEDPAPFSVHTATLKHPDGCCSSDDNYPTADEATKAAWDMAQANALVWKEAAAK